MKRWAKETMTAIRTWWCHRRHKRSHQAWGFYYELDGRCNVRYLCTRCGARFLVEAQSRRAKPVSADYSVLDKMAT